MSHQISHKIKKISSNQEREVSCLRAQVDLFRGKELRCYKNFIKRIAGSGPGRPKTEIPRDTVRQAILSLLPENRIAVLEAYIRERVADLLSISKDVLHGKTLINDLGFDSLLAIDLINCIESELGICLSLMDFFEGRSLNDIAVIMHGMLIKEDLYKPEEMGAPQTRPSGQQPEDENNAVYPLSWNQQSLWFISQIAPEASCYNVAFSCRIVSDVQPEAMRDACRQLIKRHEILRTTYDFSTGVDGQAYQTIHSEMEPGFDHIDVRGRSENALRSTVMYRYAQPFDLKNGPLVRVCLFQKKDTEHIFLVTMHHITCDGRTLSVCLNELISLYSAEITKKTPVLPDVQHHYRDFVAFQREMLRGAEGARLWNFWKERLSGTLPSMSLPIDYERPASQSFTGASYHFELEGTSYGAISRFAREEKVTPYVLLLAVFQVTLMRCCRQEDIIVGTPAAGRVRSEHKDICGHFINMVPMRCDLSGDITFRDHLQRCRRVVLQALDHQAYPFSLLVEKLGGERDYGRSPVFQVMFNMLTEKTLGMRTDFITGSTHETAVDFGELKIMPFPINKGEGQFELVLEIIDTRDSLRCIFKYCTDLFKEKTIAAVADDFTRSMHQCMSVPEVRLEDMKISGAVDGEVKALTNKNTTDQVDDILPWELPAGKAAVTVGGDVVTFMFTGQGAQYVHMAEGIYQSEPFFRECVDYCADMLRPCLGCDICTLLYPEKGDERQLAEKLNQTAVTQPVLFVLEYALARLWMRWGVYPGAMIGHSIGEYTAACLAGVFSLDEALWLVAERGRLMQMQPGGAMLAVGLSENEILSYMDTELSVAVVNAPSRCVVAGPVASVQALEKRLFEVSKGLEKKIPCTRLRTSHAFHSPMMAAAVKPFLECIGNVNPSPPEIPFISNVTGTWITDEQAVDPRYWADQLRCPVCFSKGMETLLEKKHRILLEVGPGNTLSTFARRHVKPNFQPVILTSLRHPGQRCSDESFIDKTVNSLADTGVPVDRVSRAF